jgi:hypothetical protein
VDPLPCVGGDEGMTATMARRRPGHL